MKRRTAISSMLGFPSKEQSAYSFSNKLNSRKNIDSLHNGLEKYSGTWGTMQAAHLLKRTSFGPCLEQINKAVADGLDQTMNKIMTVEPTTSDPINFEFENDPHTPIGETWIDKAYYDPSKDQELALQIRGYRNKSLATWQLGLLMEKTISIREKMTLFWHNHIPIENIQDARYKYEYIQILRRNAIGNYRSIVKDITITPAMLRYLNGRQNSKDAPNENYARELLELFSIGKGPQIAPDDYTYYTEQDVKEASRILTGWLDPKRFCQENNCDVSAEFRSYLHDEGEKTLSGKFGNKTINNQGANEYITLIDTIFEQDQCAFFISRKLYRWFVYYDVTPQIEADIIAPMAQIILDNDYNVEPAIRALLESAHFYELVGCQIKNPLDFVTSMFKSFDTKIPQDDFIQNTVWFHQHFASALLQMLYFQPTSVSGWSAFFQAPSYNQLWINSATLPGRFNYGFFLIFLGISIKKDEVELANIQIDVLDFLNQMTNPSDVNELIDETIVLLLGGGISETAKSRLKEILIPGLPDFEWTVEYNNYVDNPGDEKQVEAIRTKMQRLLFSLTQIPEFQLI